MKHILTTIAASTALALGATAVPVLAQDQSETQDQAETQDELSPAQQRGEERLAEMLEGRVAGEPQSCISTFRSNALQVIPYVGLVYESGDTIYVARAANPRSLRRTDVLVIDRTSSQLCRTDIIRTMDRGSNSPTGVLFIEDWVPYTEVEAD